MDNKSSSIDQELRLAYERTFCKVDQLGITPLIVQSCRKFDTLLKHKGSDSAVFITT